MRKTRELILAFLLLSSGFNIETCAADDHNDAGTLYPFVSHGKWGYIDSTGAWVIQPQFDRAIEILEADYDRVRVWQHDRWGYIDRAGKWIVEPRFAEPCLGSGTEAYERVCVGKKFGILAHSGKLILPTKYDDVVLLEDRAWVRIGEKLGLFDLNGHWIVTPSIEWPHGRQMPIPAEGGVSWFDRGTKSGLLSRDGKLLFPVRFARHVMGRRESEEWDHPEGLDFKNGRAWVVVGKEYWLITNEGNVLVRQPFKAVQRWTDDLYLFTAANGKQGLISREGEIKLAARFNEIRTLSDGRAVVVDQQSRMRPDGESDTWSIYGYIDTDGKIVVEPGTYFGPSGELEPFKEGLAPVWNNSSAGESISIFDPRAGYIDRNGAVVIPEQFTRSESFSEGLGAVRQAIPGHTTGNYDEYQWGYVDKTGSLAIAPQFGSTTPFSGGRAWVLKAGCDPAKPFWAMIDRTGKVLTEFAYQPPERTNRVRDSDAANLRKVRWRDGLAVISRQQFQNGLATADGKILVEPVFNRIEMFHDGIAIAVDSRQFDNHHNVKFITSLITKTGEVLATDTYTDVGDFDGGAAWATHRWTDHRGPHRNEGWGLIDTSAHELTELSYIGAHWIWSRNDKYTDNMCPKFYGKLAPVAAVKTYHRYGDKVWELNSWGYMNRAGQIIAWAEANQQ